MVRVVGRMRWKIASSPVVPSSAQSLQAAQRGERLRRPAELLAQQHALAGLQVRHGEVDGPLAAPS